MSEENISLPVAQALASALEKIEAYVPTEYVDNSEPDIDAEHLNHAEQGIMRVTNLLNAAVDVIQGQESRLEDTETKVGTAALTGGMTDLSSGVNSLYSNLAGLKDRTISIPNSSAVTIKSTRAYDAIMIVGQSGGKTIFDIIPLHPTASTVIHLGGISLNPTETTEYSTKVNIGSYSVCRAIGSGVLSISS